VWDIIREDIPKDDFKDEEATHSPVTTGNMVLLRDCEESGMTRQ
jgi:hypothetical protein